MEPDRSILKTGVVWDKRYLAHRTGTGHPEHPRRLEAVHAMLDAFEPPDALERIVPRLATRREILMVHTPGYFNSIAETKGRESSFFTADTQASAESFQTALLAVGGVFTCVDAVMDQKVKNAFALVRPPGHHAERNRAMGYCLFNNTALGAQYAKAAYGLSRILIVDWDVHHGNGTQHFFERDPAVLFFSSHRYPHFPGTGNILDTGIGAGEGYTVNVPLSSRFADAEITAVYHRLLHQLADVFAPELILVSAGFDAHRKDPLGGMRMTSNGFAALTRILMRIAAEKCAGKLILILEGGYQPDALAESVRAVLLELCELSKTAIEPMISLCNSKRVDSIVAKCRKVHGARWKNKAKVH